VGGLGWLATPTRTLYADHSESAEQLGELPSVGTDLFFIEGPVESEGYVWWRVQAYDTTHPSAASAPIGWVISAVVNADEPPVLGYVPECPSGPINAEDWQALPSYIALACFGSQPVTVEGRMTCSLAEVDGTITGPDWLQSPVNCQFATADGTPLGVVQGGWPEQLSPGEVVDGRFAVTGHLDDPQAGSCVSGGGDGGPTTEQAVQLCRQLFVRDSISRLDG